MTKVKIVQIAYMGEDNATEYLDDKGRVWYETGHYEQINQSTSHRRYVNDGWKQLDLPDEPEEK